LRAVRARAATVLTLIVAALPAPGARALEPVTGRDGPSGRYWLDGSWLFRLQGKTKPKLLKRLPSDSSTHGWQTVSVPSTWNASEARDPKMKGEVAWYRKDFELPSPDPRFSWAVRFQSVDTRAQVWLNGRPLGSHTGAYLPFEIVLPSGLLRRTGANRLVVRADSTRVFTDLPGANYWWNYGGILRPVELVRVEHVGFASVQVLPQLPCPTCAASILWRASVRNYEHTPQTVRVRASYGGLAADLGTARIPAESVRTLSATSTLPAPRLWSLNAPYLYDVRLSLQGRGTHGKGWTQLSSYSLRSGIRQVEVAPDGTLRMNGQVLNLRGVGLIEDSLQTGAALNESQDLSLLAQAGELGATAIRSQYPLSERLEELADAKGLVIWSEIPLDSPAEYLLNSPAFRAKATGALEENILENSSHPSIAIWSIGNELSGKPQAGQYAYIAQAAAEAHALDPTRPVGMAVAGDPANGCQAGAYAPLNVIGLNDYFGWYAGIGGDLANREGLAGYLNAMHACLPGKALLVTEMGAEANREGPATERGTYAFQQEFVKYHLETFNSLPWLSGAFYWALQEFRVTPGWAGGNPKPSPPLHTKGLISFAGTRKPAFYEAQRLYRATDQIHAP
jgi:Glycosyl hydrolases family 2, TIM barrel domain/Glycosyl hydrolases family 2, sugar binding domain